MPKKHAFSHTELVEVSHNTPINKHNETFRQAQGDKCVSPNIMKLFKDLTKDQLADLFRKTEKAHVEYEKATGKTDPN